MLIETHDNEATDVGHYKDEPGKPWTFSCECGAISWHKTENAANMARKRHMNDESLFLRQIERAESRVRGAVADLHRALDDEQEARAVYKRWKENRG